MLVVFLRLNKFFVKVNFKIIHNIYRQEKQFKNEILTLLVSEGMKFSCRMAFIHFLFKSSSLRNPKT